MNFTRKVDTEQIRATLTVTKSTLHTLPPAFRERMRNAMAMYRGGALKYEVTEKHGGIVAKEAIEELNRVDPKWWAK